MAKLILVRGLPGSGKSTYAKALIAESGRIGYAHIEADMFFVTEEGYKFDPTKLKEAHLWCLQVAHLWLYKMDKRVIVSNTFTQRWEMEKYLWLAELLDIPVEVHKCTGTWQNVHGVPPEALERMKSRWEDYDGEICVPL